MIFLNIFTLVILATFSSAVNSTFTSDEDVRNPPAEVTLNFELEDGIHIDLKLTKKETLDDDSFRIMTSSQDDWHSESHQDLDVYEDVEHTASFTITTIQENGTEFHTYFGSFLHGGKAYTMTPADEGVSEGAVRTYKVKLHGRDYVVAESTDEVNFEENDAKRRKKRSIQKDLVLEVLAVIDYTVYRRWFKFNKKNKAKTLSNIVPYYAHILTGMAGNYEKITSSKYSFTVRISGIYICDTKKDSMFTIAKKLKLSKDTIDYDKVLELFKEFLSNKGTKLPQHDLAAAFTKLKAPGTTVGRAYMGAACTDQKLSINLDNGVYGTADTLAHEIGHNLGAEHDGVDHKCPQKDQFLMSSSHSSTVTIQHHTFSPCSINYFEKYIDGLEEKQLNCFSQKMTLKKHQQINQDAKQMLGTMYSANRQCILIYGPKSYFCSNGKDSDEEICEKMLCYEPSKKECVFSSSSFAMQGTPCGQNKWCKEKKCVYDAKAPANKKSCIHGDLTETIDYNGSPLRCGQLESMKHVCYHENMAKFCCKTCKRLKGKNPTCMYGDKTPSCASRVGVCHVPSNRDLCCETCQKVKARNQPDCPYGDTSESCASQTHGCSDESFRKACCETCGKHLPIPKKPPTSNPPTPNTPTTEPLAPRKPAQKGKPSDPTVTKASVPKSPSANDKAVSGSTKDCPSGDIYKWCKPDSFHCKEPNGQRVCCETCKKYKEATPGITSNCPKGDTMYNCASMETRCWSSAVRQRCCQTCENVRLRNQAACPYGDKMTNCAERVYACYNRESYDMCCETCAKATSKNTASCPYGDMLKVCYDGYCTTPSLKRMCCGTCGDS